MSQAITINHLWKKYTLGQPKKFSEALPQWLIQKKPQTVWALKNINLSIKAGERVGIIGPNGSGKSTLLKILSGVTPPTKGSYQLHGQATSLLELGIGFHPDLTGRENIYLYGSMLGLSQSQVNQNFNSIVNFAQLKRFIDTPVKHYSSGMYIRLAFSVMTQLNTDILLIDEVFAVGDASFQQKSFAKLEKITSTKQTTVVIVSHNLENIQHFCDRVFLFDQGRVIHQGKAHRVTEVYLDQLPAQPSSLTSQTTKAIQVVSSQTYKHSPINKTEIFDQPSATKINQARLDHLKSLKLPLSHKKVLDVGAGVGILAQYFVSQNCKVTCLDARKANIKSLRNRYPKLKRHSFVINLETQDISKFGLFDIVFCYGLLYHLEKPALVLEKLAAACKQLLLLECCITDHFQPINLWVEETYTYNQALRGIGSRPTPSFLISALHHAGFAYIYFPKSKPQHLDFKFKYLGNLTHQRQGHPLRQVIIASKKSLTNSSLKLVSVINKS